MPSFIVYLPPTLVDLKDVSAAHVPISFRTIPRPASLESQSLSLGRDSLLGRLLVDQDPTVDRNGKRKATTDDLDDSVPSVIFTDETDLRVPSAPDIVEDLSESVNQDFIWETTRHGIGIEDEGKDVVVSHHVETGTKAFLRPSSPTQEARPDPAPPRRAGPSSRIQHTGPRIGLHGDASRRQSKRLKATGKFFRCVVPRRFILISVDLMAALPALQADDSIVSLNTTISNPSQLPPSGQEGDTSMYNLPRFTIPLSKLSPLDTLLSNNKSRRDSQSLDAKVHVIVCITSTTAPVVRKRKEERVRGMDGTLWIAKWDVVAPSSSTGGREAGCEVVLWDKCARDYGEYVRRGDVVLLESESIFLPFVSLSQG